MVNPFIVAHEWGAGNERIMTVESAPQIDRPLASR